MTPSPIPDPSEAACAPYVYIRSEPGLYTVGFWASDGRWVPESDYSSTAEAAERVNWLNGGAFRAQPEEADPAPSSESLAADLTRAQLQASVLLEALRAIADWNGTTDSWYRLARHFQDLARRAVSEATDSIGKAR